MTSRLFPLLMLLFVAGTGTIRAELTEAQKKELIRKQHTGGSSEYTGKKKSRSGKSGGEKSGSGKASGPASKKRSSSGSSGSSGSNHSSGTKKKTYSGSTDGQHASTSAPSHHVTPATTPPHSHDHQIVQATAAGVTTPIIPTSPSPAAPSSALPLPHGAEPSAPITIEKSGVETEQGLEPVPEPVAEGFWGKLFGTHKNYAYLSFSVRSAIDHAPVKRGRWKYIVVHNSGTREGNARVFDIYHRRVRHMVNGLAYHFVIGDGHGSGDGQIEIGDRWKRQINGGHVASDYLNDIALGICLVGDFNRDLPTPAQVMALEELIPYLRARVGKSQGRQAIVHAHKEINPRPTDCPGDRFPYTWLHAKFGNAR